MEDPLDPFLGSKPRDPDQLLGRYRVKTTLKNQNEITFPSQLATNNRFSYSPPTTRHQRKWANFRLKMYREDPP